MEESRIRRKYEIAILALFGAAAGVSLCCVIFMGVGRSRAVERVDLQKVSPLPAHTSTEDAPLLTVAVAAMLTPAETLSTYESLLTEISKIIGRKTRLVQRTTYAEINQKLLSGNVDMAFLCSGGYISLPEDCGVRILVVPEIEGKRTYQCYIIARSDSGVRSFADLRGKRFAFTDRLSNTGCYYPTCLALEAGAPPEEYFSDLSYSGSHSRSIRSVRNGFADGAAVDGLIFEWLARNDPQQVEGLAIINRSPPFAIPPVVVGPKVDPEVFRQLRDTFLRLHEKEGTKGILKKMGIDRFVVPEDGMYDSLRKMTERCRRKAP
ncbi:MAG: phosphate/phosphite/phosphonate ABC transporter substrate-binding protein [Planctomycetes bacterium]|nr:phosphate/phosphite/phosphonate ABC transporter substrate-binding protein [Planctomycetota bacterium]